MDGKSRSASGIASQTDALAKLEAEVFPQWFSGGRLFGTAFFGYFFLLLEKSDSPVGATTHTTII